MRLLAITSFPPSTRAASYFGYNAVLRFLESPNVTELIVLADILDDSPNEKLGDSSSILDNRLTIDRCWHYNSVKCFLDIVISTVLYRPDVVWINLQYTTFGVRPVPAFFGLCIPLAFRLLQYPTAILLHNYLGGVNLERMGLPKIKAPMIIAYFADQIAMYSIMCSDKILTMVRAYQKDLSTLYPRANVCYVRQDLFSLPKYRSVNLDTHNILTIGYFGTYKKLEILIHAFEFVRHIFPDAVLTISGIDSMHTPGYIQSLKERFSAKLDNIVFSGYISEQDLPNLFWNSNLVVITNNTSSGDSGVVELARVYGRAILVPKQICDETLEVAESGVIFYDFSNVADLALQLIELLGNPSLQKEIGKDGYKYTSSRRNSFLREHIRIFESLTTKKKARLFTKGQSLRQQFYRLWRGRDYPCPEE